MTQNEAETFFALRYNYTFWTRLQAYHKEAFD